MDGICWVVLGAGVVIWLGFWGFRRKKRTETDVYVCSRCGEKDCECGKKEK